MAANGVGPNPAISTILMPLSGPDPTRNSLMNDSIGPSFDLVLAQIKRFSGILAGALNQYAQ
jgi:hypothetical protein